jgi:ABC-2 type transport system ATP-binding protein
MDIIRTKGLTKQFGDFVAVDGVTLTVPEGQVLALLGPNGAGKTTTVRMLASILRPTSGWATIASYDVVKDSRTVRRIVGLLTEFPGLYLRMRALEYLDFFGQLQGLSPQQIQQRSEELLIRFKMWEARDLRLGEYSKGMRQKLALIRAMLHDPQVLFLDEPTSAMDPHSAKLVRDCILDLRCEQHTIILCTHNLAEAELLADRVAIIRRGQIVALGTLAELRARLLGDPVLELRLVQPLDGLLPLITDLINIEEQGETWLRYRTAQPELINPILIQRLAQQGTEVITLSEVPRSLEDVYLKIVEE